MAKRNFNNFLESFMEYCSYVEAPEKFLRWSALSILAGSLERKVWLTNGAATWYPNLYVMLVGEPGCRKSTSSEIAIDLLREVPGITFFADRINEATFITRLKSSGFKKHVVFNGEEYKHSAAYLYASEAATSFSEMYHGGGIIITLTDLFNCGPKGWHNVHAWTKSTMKDGETQVFNPCINMLACSTANWLTTKVMSKDDIEGGFGSRIIMVVHKGEYRRSFKWAQANQREAKMRSLLIEDLIHINQITGPFSYDATFPIALEGFDEGHNKAMREISSPQLMKAYQARKIDHMLKVAQILSISKSDDLVLTGEDLVEAWELLTNLEQDMTDIVIKPLVVETQVVKQEVVQLNLVKDYIQKSRKSSITKTEVYAEFSHIMSPKQVGTYLIELCRGGILEPVPNTSLLRLEYKIIGVE